MGLRFETQPLLSHVLFLLTRSLRPWILDTPTTKKRLGNHQGQQGLCIVHDHGDLKRFEREKKGMHVGGQASRGKYWIAGQLSHITLSLSLSYLALGQKENPYRDHRFWYIFLFPIGFFGYTFLTYSHLCFDFSKEALPMKRQERGSRFEPSENPRLTPPNLLSLVSRKRKKAPTPICLLKQKQRHPNNYYTRGLEAISLQKNTHPLLRRFHSLALVRWAPDVHLFIFLKALLGMMHSDLLRLRTLLWDAVHLVSF